MKDQPVVDTSPFVSDEVRKTTCYMCACRCGINVHMKAQENGDMKVPLASCRSTRPRASRRRWNGSAPVARASSKKSHGMKPSTSPPAC